jgi:hypothetical protein
MLVMRSSDSIVTSGTFWLDQMALNFGQFCTTMLANGLECLGVQADKKMEIQYDNAQTLGLVASGPSRIG